MHRVALCLVLIGTPAIAQDFIRYFPPTLPITGGTLTGALTVPAGTCAAPGFKIGALGWGLSDPGGAFDICYSVTRFRFDSNALTFFGSAGNTTVVLGPDGASNVLQHGSDAATAAAQTIKGPDSTGATIAGGSLTLKGGAGTSGIANGGALILSGGDKSSTGEPGAVGIADGGTKPTCDAARRGSFWYDAGGAGVADTFEICSKSAADAYAWRSTSVLIP